MSYRHPFAPSPLQRTLFSALLALVFVTHGAAATREYQLKAAFLYNFTKFIEWPPDRFPTPESPIVIGVLGVNPFNGELTQVVEGRLVNGRAVSVRAVTTTEEAKAVHLLFIPAGQEIRFEAIRSQLDSNAVVTVGETARFTALGGLIRFVNEADKIRFAVREHTEHPLKVRLSAHLLKLAITVEH